eukprot:5278120-Pleurochrysis_carterae.AAC.1
MPRLRDGKRTPVTAPSFQIHPIVRRQGHSCRHRRPLPADRGRPQVPARPRRRPLSVQGGVLPEDAH